MNSTVELTRFRVAPARREELLAARAGMVEAFEVDRDGFLGAHLIELPDGEWLDVVLWRSTEAFASSRAKGANLPAIGAFFAPIEELVSSEEGVLADVAVRLGSDELRRAHGLLRELSAPAAALLEARALYLQWSERFPVPDGTTIERLPRDEGLVVVGPGIEPIRTVLHVHGGGFTIGAASTHRELAARLSVAAHARVLLLDYPLAPEHPFPAAQDAAVTLYRHLVEDGVDPATMMLSGDSAGGNLVLTTLLRLRAEGLPLPGGAMVMSPWTDLTHSGATMDSRAARDPLASRDQLSEMARNYLGGHSPTDPLVSPLFAELGGLPPLLIQVGNEEVLLDDSRRLAAAARSAGVDVTLSVTPGAPHIWQHFGSFLPEAVAAIEEYGSFAAAHVRATEPSA